MKAADPLENHRQLCDELYALTLEENHFLKEHHCVPVAELTERKRALLQRLDESLAALKAVPKESRLSPEAGQAAHKAMARILQVLHLDRENEQLLLRYSLAPRSAESATPAAPAADLKKVYR